MSDPIYHLVPAEYFYSLPPDQAYLPREFAHEGFIHCTAPAARLTEVANRYLASTPGDYLVLVIDPERLSAPLRWEGGITPAGHTGPARPATDLEAFPHIYGPLNRDALTDIRRMRRHADGQFDPFDKSLPLHASERDLFLTPRPGDPRTFPLDIQALLRRFDSTQRTLDGVRHDLAARMALAIASPADTNDRQRATELEGQIGRLMRDTLTRMQALDSEIEYFLAHGTLAGYSAPAASPEAPVTAEATTPVATAPPAAVPAAADDPIRAQLEHSSRAALDELALGTFDGATTRYLTALAIAGLASAFCLTRGLETPAPAHLLETLEGHDPEFSGWTRAVLTVATPTEARHLLNSLYARAFQTPAPAMPTSPSEAEPFGAPD